MTAACRRARRGLGDGDGPEHGHLAGCARCRRYAARLRARPALLRALAPSLAPARVGAVLAAVLEGR